MYKLSGSVQRDFFYNPKSTQSNDIFLVLSQEQESRKPFPLSSESPQSVSYKEFDLTQKVLTF